LVLSPASNGKNYDLRISGGNQTTTYILSGVLSESEVFIEASSLIYLPFKLVKRISI